MRLTRKGEFVIAIGYLFLIIAIMAVCGALEL